MNRPRARLYLDVDGVLNILGSPARPNTTTITIAQNHGGGYATQYPATFSPAIVTGLETLRADFDLELVWLTSWLEGAGMIDQLTTATGLRGGRRLSIPIRTRGNGGTLPFAWKRDELLADIARDPVPFIWADDDGVPAHESFVRGAVGALPALMIAPDPDVGLTAQDLTAMRAFLEGLN